MGLRSQDTILFCKEVALIGCETWQMGYIRHAIRKSQRPLRLELYVAYFCDDDYRRLRCYISSFIPVHLFCAVFWLIFNAPFLATDGVLLLYSVRLLLHGCQSLSMFEVFNCKGMFRT